VATEEVEVGGREIRSARARAALRTRNRDAAVFEDPIGSTTIATLAITVAFGTG